MLSLITKQNRLAKLAFLLWMMVMVRCGAVLVQTRMAWPDRKVALRIPARSARDIPVAGRFALRSMLSAFQYLCGFYKAKTPDALRSMPSASTPILTPA